eukprot:6131244-Prymnesium_polylepis.2
MARCERVPAGPAESDADGGGEQESRNTCEPCVRAQSLVECRRARQGHRHDTDVATKHTQSLARRSPLRLPACRAWSAIPSGCHRRTTARLWTRTNVSSRRWAASRSRG